MSFIETHCVLISPLQMRQSVKGAWNVVAQLKILVRDDFPDVMLSGSGYAEEKKRGSRIDWFSGDQNTIRSTELALEDTETVSIPLSCVRLTCPSS